MCNGFPIPYHFLPYTVLLCVLFGKLGVKFAYNLIENAEKVEILPLETTVDKRDDARIRCQATAEAPSPTPTSRATATVPAGATAPPQATPQSTSQAVTLGKGRIAFTSYDAIRQRYDVYVVDLAQGDARLLQADGSQPALSPDGRMLAFRNMDEQHLGLGILNLSSNTVSELTAHHEDASPTWSPGMDQLVFASDKHGDDRWRVYVISPYEIRGDGEEWALGQKPDWSQDGGRIAYHGCDERGDNCGIWVVQPGGFNAARLTTDASDTAAAWSPDGTQVAFASRRTGNWELHLVEIATGQEKRLTENTSVDYAPAWSPDGRDIAFESNRDTSMDIYVMDADGKNIRRLTDHPANDYDPTWSPDGQSIAFVSNRDGNSEIYMMDVSGKNVRSLTDNPAEDSEPDWFGGSARSVQSAGKQMVTWSWLKRHRR